MTATDPESGDQVEVTNLLSADGLQMIVTDMVTNFTSFPPLGVIITVMLGVAVAEHSGLISAAVRSMVARTGPKTLTFTVALAGVTGSIASDAIFIVIIPLGAMAFNALGRSPIVGAIVAFAAAAAGFDASLLLNITDVLLAGLSTTAAQLVDPEYVVNPLANYYFVIVSSIVLALLITALTELFMDRKIHQIVDHDEIDYDEVNFTDEDGNVVTDLTLRSIEVRGLKLAGLTGAAFLAVYFALLFAPVSPLQGEGGAVMESPLITDIAAPISVGFFLLGTVYGLTIKSITKATDNPDFLEPADPGTLRVFRADGGVPQLDDHLRVGAMGTDGPDRGPDDDVHRHLARSHPDALPHRRLDHQHRDADEPLLRHGLRLPAALL